jgi:CheY-like chemotaxis protein
MVQTGKRVLLVDDDEGVQTVLAHLLNSSGYETLVASDGVTGLKKAATGRPDLVLLDIMMPGLSGEEVLRKLKVDPTTARIPVIMLSAIDDAKSMERCFNGGAFNYIVKPVKIDALLEILERALSPDVRRSEGGRLRRDPDPPRPSAAHPPAEAHWLLLRQELQLLLLTAEPSVARFREQVARGLAVDPQSPEIQQLEGISADLSKLLTQMSTLLHR